MMYFAIGGLFYLVGMIFAIMIIVHAFQKGGTGPGLMCIFVPFYILYWAFSKYENPKKNLHLTGFLGGAVVGAIFFIVGYTKTISNVVTVFGSRGLIQRGAQGLDSALRRGLDDLGRGLRDIGRPTEPPR